MDTHLNALLYMNGSSNLKQIVDIVYMVLKKVEYMYEKIVKIGPTLKHISVMV